jgi:hypothetical protein
MKTHYLIKFRLQNQFDSIFKEVSKKLTTFTFLILFMSFFINIQSQTTSSLDLTWQVAPGSYGNLISVAYNPNNDYYYVASGGSNSYGITVLKSDGSLIGYSHNSVDKRGIWFNPNTNRIEGNAYGSAGYYYLALNGSGIMTSENVFQSGRNQPDGQSVGDYDFNSNEIIFFHSNSVYRYSPSGSQLGSLSLSIPSGHSVLLYPIAYTGISGKEYALYSKSGNSVLLFNKSTGSCAEIITLNGALSSWDWGFSYANGTFFLSNGTLLQAYSPHAISGNNKAVIGVPNTLTFKQQTGVTFQKWYRKLNNGSWEVFNSADLEITETYTAVNDWYYKVEYVKGGVTLQTYEYKVQAKYAQTITLSDLPEKALTQADYDPGATASSGLSVTYSSSNNSIASIVSNKIRPVAAGTCTIYADQAGDASYWPAPQVSRSQVIKTSLQTITFNALPAKTYGDANFSPGATASSGLSVVYTSSNEAVATIVSGQIKIVGVGSTTIHANQLGNSTYAAAVQVSQQLTVNKATATVTLGSLSATYNGEAKAATATTSPAGLTVDFTYNGSATAPTNAGTYAVIGTINNANYQGSANGSLVIGKATATVTLGSLSATYNGSAKAATATTSPAGLTVDFTYNGSATAPTNAGTYAVVGTINNSNYQGSANGSLVIGKATATVTLGSLSATYNGSAKAATATTSPAGLTVDFTYNSSATAPTNAGTYAVVGTINDANYQGSANGSLVIGKATATVTLGSLSATYNGSAKAVTATTSPAGLTVDFTYNSSATAPTNAGTYAVVGTINNSNYQGSANGSLVIGKATATVTLGSLSATYNGSAKAATATTSPAGLSVGFTYDGSATAPTNAGTYAVVGTINDANYQGSANGSLVIGKATATVTLGSLSATYNGSAKAATATTSPAGLTVDFTYDGSATAPTNAGTYAVVGTINDVNYQGSANGSLVIGKATATVTLGSLSATYNGEAKAATATTSPEGLSVDFTYNESATAPTNAGTYAVVGTINNSNYQGSANGSLVIGKATATVTLGSLSATYNGSAKAATATTSPEGLSVDFTYDGSATAPTNAGTYAVVGTINNANYQGSANGSMVIGKATATVTLGSLSATYNGSAKAATATTSPAGLTVDFTYNSSATAPTNAGTYAVVGTINNANYQGSANGSLVIGKATATVTLGSLSATYNGEAKAATAITSPEGLSVEFTYDGSATAPTNAGTYAVVGTINDINYQGSDNGSLVIGKATATVTLGSLSATYNGEAKAATAITSPEGLSVEFTYDGSATAPTNAGTYAVVGTINDINYQGSDNGSLVIGKATATVTLGSLSATYNGEAKAATATTSPEGLTVDFTYDGSATAPTNAGTYAVVGTINDANYQGSDNGSLVIGKATATVTLGSLSANYNGEAKAATAITSPEGLTVDFTYDGSATAPTNAGTYAVVGTINDANYQGSDNGSLVIGKATATVTLGSLSANL